MDYSSDIMSEDQCTVPYYQEFFDSKEDFSDDTSAVDQYPVQDTQ